MKVTGPSSGVPADAAASADPVEETGRPPAAGAADQASGARFADKLAAEQVAPPGQTTVPGLSGVDPLAADIAAELAAGKIAPKAAIDRVVERILDQQLGADAPAAARDRLRAVLEDTLESDPMLVQKLRDLGA
jgi:hypothetical protein